MSDKCECLNVRVLEFFLRAQLHIAPTVADACLILIASAFISDNTRSRMRSGSCIVGEGGVLCV